MKKTIIILLIILLSACGTSNSTNVSDKNDEVIDSVDASDASNPIQESLVYLCSGIKSYHEDGSMYKTYEYEYYDNGCIKKITQTDLDASHCEGSYPRDAYPFVNVTEYKENDEFNPDMYEVPILEDAYYDESGRIIYEHDWLFGGMYYVYKYDVSGNLIKYGGISAMESVSNPTEISSDIDTLYNKLDSDVWFSDEYQYDEYNRLIKTIHDEGDLYSYILSIDYNEQGNIAKQTAYDVNGKMTGWTEYSYFTINESDAKINELTEKLLFVKTRRHVGCSVEPDHASNPY